MIRLIAAICVAIVCCRSVQAIESQPGSIALLVRTATDDVSAPPYALLDQFGQVQRYVEPSPGIDLANYLGRRVRVLHDTGETLLASQLELDFEAPLVMQADAELEELPAQGDSLEPIASDTLSPESVEPIMLDELPFPTSRAMPTTEYRFDDRPIGTMPAPCESCGRRRCTGCTQPSAVTTPKLHADAEFLFMRYYRADGVRTGYVNAGTGAPEDIDFDHDLAPRFTLAYGGSGELGARVRYWQFDQTAGPVNGGSTSQLDVDTYSLDFELFERRRLAPQWTVEFSGGLRYTDFSEVMLDNSLPIGTNTISNQVDGWGGLVGAELTRSLSSRGNLYARTRLAILQDDHSVSYGVPSGTVPPFQQRQANLIDSTHTMLELGLGYEFRTQTRRGSILFARAGYEWQHWSNFSTSFTPAASNVALTPTLAGPSDVGFGGFALGVGLER